MTIKTYYVSKSGETKLSSNFKVKEFQCHDKTDKVLIDSDLVNLLQSIRSHFKRPVIITSAYRTAAYFVNFSQNGDIEYHNLKVLIDNALPDYFFRVVGE